MWPSCREDETRWYGQVREITGLNSKDNQSVVWTLSGLFGLKHREPRFWATAAWLEWYTNYCLVLPGRRGQRDDESLQQPSDIWEGIFASKEEEEERQQDKAVHKQTRQDSDEVHAQLLSQVGRVVHIKDLPCHKEHNAKGEVPEGKEGRHNFVVMLLLPIDLHLGLIVMPTVSFVWSHF